MSSLRASGMRGSDSDVLLADIGGTHVRFALADPAAAIPLLGDSVHEFPIGRFASLADAARHYLGITGSNTRHGVFAVAGRVEGDQARITNHPWLISNLGTRLALGLDTLRLVNDFAAQALALPLLAADDVVPLGEPGWSVSEHADYTFAVIGPGTGLGVGGLLRRDGRVHALQTEGGHVGFAPGTPEEIAILQRLSDSFGRVSNERLLSGAGLVNLHGALAAGYEDNEDAGALQPHDITARARSGDVRCLHTIELFCAVFGAAAGDLVLTLGAWDGVLLTGGLVPKLLPWLVESPFRARFQGKGRFAAAMARVPVLAVVHPQPGLLGAAMLAAQPTQD